MVFSGWPNLWIRNLKGSRKPGALKRKQLSVCVYMISNIVIMINDRWGREDRTRCVSLRIAILWPKLKSIELETIEYYMSTVICWFSNVHL